MMLASASGELNTRSSPNSRCRPWVSLKTPPLPLTSGSASFRLASATSSPKTTMRGSRAISSLSVRLMAVHHRVGLALRLGGRVEGGRRRDRRRASRRQSSAVSFAGFGAASAASAASLISRVDLGRHRREIVVGGEAVRAEELGEARDRIAPRFGLALRRRLVELLVVGQRVRVGADDVRVDERGPLRRAHVGRAASRIARRLARKSVPSIESTCRPGNDRTRREMSPPGVCTSTGTEIA